MILRSIVLILLFFTLPLQAHVVEQLFADFEPSEHEVHLTIRFDAGYALPEMRADTEAMQPKFAWLTEQSHQELARLKQEAANYLETYFSLHWVDQESGHETPLDFTSTFPAWQTDPPAFDQRFTDMGFAYFSIICTSKLPDTSGTLQLSLNHGNHPDLAIGFPDKTIITAYPGKRVTLLQKQDKGTPHTEISTPTSADSFLSFLDYGYRHVIPEGWDHVLFILALVCLSFAWKALLTQSLIFTLGHTITLALAVSGVIPPLSGGMTTLVEIFIAATIAYVAIENLVSKQVKTHRLTMIFLFGLIHGLGFASVLGDKIRAAGDIAMPLIAANLGVELGQITVIAITLAALFWARKKSYFPIILKSISAAIAVTGCYWVMDRIPF